MGDFFKEFECEMKEAFRRSAGRGGFITVHISVQKFAGWELSHYCHPTAYSSNKHTYPEIATHIQKGGKNGKKYPWLGYDPTQPKELKRTHNKGAFTPENVARTLWLFGEKEEALKACPDFLSVLAAEKAAREADEAAKEAAYQRKLQEKKAAKIKYTAKLESIAKQFPIGGIAYKSGSPITIVGVRSEYIDFRYCDGREDSHHYSMLIPPS